MTCAGNNTVAALIAGAIDPSAARRLEAHLDTCETCRRLVADLGRGLSALDEDRLPRAGDLVGRYAIRRVVGVGGMGVVYEATDTALDRRVALKLLRPDLAAAPSTLLAEAKAMARLSHRNIAAIHDVGTAHGQLYLCMEFVAGVTLREWIAEAPRTRTEVLEVFVAAARGLAYVHREGVVHLDFKPDNVLIDRSGRVVVTDFGVAAMVGDAGVIAGTPAYMAPEQRRGEPTDACADQFAFCTALAEALARSSSDLPGWLRRVIDRGRADRDARFATMDEVIGALERGMRRRRRRLAAAAMVVAASGLALLVSRAPETVTRWVDRPVIERIFERAPETASPAPVAAADEPAPDPRALGSSRAARTLALALALDRRVPERAIVFASGDPMALPRIVAPRDDGARLCDDGGERTCTSDAPWCPAGSTLALQEGCWTCADQTTCASLGTPRACDDGSPLRCARDRPTCGGRELPSVRGGCWTCADPFTCTARSTIAPVPVPLNRCGNGVCDPGEDRVSCASDCAGTSTGSEPRSGAGSGSGVGSASGNGSGSGAGNGSGIGIGSGSGNGSSSGSGSGVGSGSGNGAWCGNGVCEIGEDHVSCPSDCCELTSNGSCAPVCGDQICELDEDHVSCPADCCMSAPGGTCVAVCGNQICELGEDPQTCPADCHSLR